MLVGPLRVFLKTKVSEMYARAMNKLDKQVRTQSLIANSHSIGIFIFGGVSVQLTPADDHMEQMSKVLMLGPWFGLRLVFDTGLPPEALSLSSACAPVIALMKNGGY